MTKELVLVTGAAGFIGSHLCDGLLAAGYRVRAADNLSAGRLDNLAQARTHDAFEFIEADVAELKACHELCRDVKAVLHQAALASVPASIDDPPRAHRDTATTTLHLLTAALRAGASRFVTASSASCYDERASLPVAEDAPLAPMSPYAAAKICSEFYLKAFAAMGLDGVSLRYFNVYGPRQDPDASYAGVMPAFISRLLAGRQPTIFGDGEQTRDFIFVGDVVRANLAALEAGKPLSGVSINVASGIATSVNQLAKSLAGLCAMDLNPEYLATRAGDFRHSRADVSRAAELLGFRADKPLAEGLEAVVQWMRSRLPATP